MSMVEAFTALRHAVGAVFLHIAFGIAGIDKQVVEELFELLHDGIETRRHELETALRGGAPQDCKEAFFAHYGDRRALSEFWVWAPGWDAALDAAAAELRRLPDEYYPEDIFTPIKPDETKHIGALHDRISATAGRHLLKHAALVCENLKHGNPDH